jgi:hypothetical protein
MQVAENEYGQYVSCIDAGIAESITEARRRKIGFPILWEKKFFLFSTISIPALGPTQTPVR